ncbi:Hexokinase [Cooperia oncophora]
MDELGIEDYSFSDILLFREVCLVVSRRSANLIAAAIACVLNRIRRPKMTVAIDGSTYKYHPFFEHWVVEKVKELLDPGLKFKVVQTSDGSGKGAALIAAIVTRMKRKEEETRRKQGAPQVNESIETEKKLHDEKRCHLETYEHDYRPKGPQKPSHMVVELSYNVDDGVV